MSNKLFVTTTLVENCIIILNFAVVTTSSKWHHVKLGSGVSKVLISIIIKFHIVSNFCLYNHSNFGNL